MNIFKTELTETVSRNLERHHYLLDGETFYLYASGARAECIGTVHLQFQQETGYTKATIRTSDKKRFTITPRDYGEPVAKFRQWAESLGQPDNAYSVEDLLS